MRIVWLLSLVAVKTFGLAFHSINPHRHESRAVATRADSSLGCVEATENEQPRASESRRSVLAKGVVGLTTLLGGGASAMAEDGLQVSAEELDALYDSDDATPAWEPPEERSGLVVLRVAEVAQFQEKILRAVVNGDLPGVKVAPMQFVFGTQILLRNSNLDGNMKLMIYNEIPKKYRKEAIANAVKTMNTLQGIATYAASIERDFEPIEMITLADMYRDVRVYLNEMYDYLPPKEKDRYYGYFVAVTEYEKKVAQGTYNPDIDGRLSFD